METADKNLNLELKRLDFSRILINLLLVLFILINAAAFVVFVVFLVLFIVKTVGSGFHFTFFALFVGAIGVALIDNLWFLFKVIAKRRAWRVRFKNFAVPYVFSKIFDGAEYNHGKGIEKAIINKSGIVSANGYYHSEDLLTGKYKGVGFARADVRVRLASGRKGAYVGDAFMGQWLIFDFNKPIDAYVRVLERSLISSNNVLGVMLKNSPIFKNNVGVAKDKIGGGQKVQVEDISFNKKFEIITHNPHTAFYILTPQFIEAVKYLEKQIEGQLVLAFSDSLLHVAVNTHKSDFEAKLSLNAQMNMGIIRTQVLKTAKFIDILRLDNDYFKQ